MTPALPASNNGVLLLGEALGADERDLGKPFVGRAGLTLTRLIEWAGFNRADFMIANAVWCKPPDNSLDGMPYEHGAVSHCKEAHWGRLIERAKVVVPMGNVPLSAMIGRKGILSTRGYVRSGPGESFILPTIHPSYILRGARKMSAAFINDIKKAVDLAANKMPMERFDYTLDPPPGVALEWAKEYRRELERNPTIKLAYDIETPGKGEDEGDLDDEDDPTYTIYRIGFAYKPFHALSIPWLPEYMAAIRLLLASDGDKVDWNGSFDRPRVRAAGVAINGVIHDGMIAWHVLHSDLPKGLAFVATFTCPWQQEWKHLSHARPAFYNATDADVELRSMIAIEAELKKTGLWHVYERDVLDFDPVLRYMESVGMPIDAGIRYEKAVELAKRTASVEAAMEAAVPIDARRWEPKDGFKKTPADTSGLIEIRVDSPVKRCDRCGLLNPTKPHFKTIKRPTEKRPQNPCSGAGVVTREEEVTRFARLIPFKPSREQLIRYQQSLGRLIPTKYDKKTRTKKASLDEKALKKLMIKFPTDVLYQKVLEYRELKKVAGTYLGYPNEGS